MLFNSYQFIFLFLPFSIVLYLITRRIDPRLGILCLLGCSFLFYAAWDVLYLPLLLASILGNFAAGLAIGRARRDHREAAATAVLTIAIVANLSLLGYFKYLHFFVNNLNYIAESNIVLERILLPLGISFFTFEQIAYLIDIRRGETEPGDLLSYGFFVAFFPRLIAGPILRFTEIAPQLPHAHRRLALEDVAVGSAIFVIGLFKKSVLADGIAPFATGVFTAADQGQPIDLLMGWGGALAYTCQLYFDFSGYSDMAVGAARCCGFRFPANFNSPYKAASISEFWRRWHMTLSRFLRDYLYIALGGNRHGPVRRYLNLMLTMLIGGLWHGANWTFVFWGGLHGIYLVVDHAWNAGSRRWAALSRWRASRLALFLAVAVTFLAVVIGWVFFRASTFSSALGVLAGMSGANGVVIPSGLAFGLIGELALASGMTIGGGSGTVLVKTYLGVSVLLAIAFFAPNTQQIVGAHAPVLDAQAQAPKSRLHWMPTPRWALIVALLGFVGTISISRTSEFLYWQF